MAETRSENLREAWKGFLSKHWGIVVLFVAAAVLASVGAILVSLWFAGEAQSTGLVPSSLGSWAMVNLVTFLVYWILWELLFIGIPVAIAAVAGWAWWRRLPEEEKREYHFFDRRSRSASGGGGISLLVFIAFCIKVFLDGKWSIAFASWTFDYLVYSILWTLIWIAIIFGIPITIGLIVWIRCEMKKKP